MYVFITIYYYVNLQPMIMLLLKMFPGIMIHGQFSTSEVSTYTNNTSPMLTSQEIICRHYIVLSHTLESAVELLGFQPNSKVKCKILRKVFISIITVFDHSKYSTSYFDELAFLCA